MILPDILTVTGLVSVELEFFGINVDTQGKRLVWTVGAILSAIAGYGILRSLRDESHG